MIDDGPTLYLVPYSLYSAFIATSDTRFYRNNKWKNDFKGVADMLLETFRFEDGNNVENVWDLT